MSERSLPHHVSAPGSNYQVRILRERQLHSRNFPWSRYTSPTAALKEAVRWRDSVLAELGPAPDPKMPRDKPLRHKTSGCPAGITCYLRTDSRKSGNPQYLTFAVNYQNSRGQKATKSFQVGNVEVISQLDREHAALSAQAFREEWAWCRKNGRPFDARKYADWRQAKLYPFVAPE